jgi:hypothetical protein
VAVALELVDDPALIAQVLLAFVDVLLGELEMLSQHLAIHRANLRSAAIESTRERSLFPFVSAVRLVRRKCVAQ